MQYNQSGGRQNSQNRNRGRRGGMRKPSMMPTARKSNARAADRPHHVQRRSHFSSNRDANGLPEIVPAGSRNFKKMGKMMGGNLANPHINEALFSGRKIDTNAPSSYPDGQPVRVIPLGGTGEVGMNMTAIETDQDIILIDTGMGFGGGEKFPGVDYIIPDTAYIEQNRHKIRGLIYTHGHLDHIGAAPYILPKLGSIPIFGLPLSLALLKNRLQDYEIGNKLYAKVIDLDKPLRLGAFSIDFFRLNHSIPDVIGLSIDSPMGRILYCTDWKFDNTPFDGKLSDYGKLAELGDQGVRLLLTDSLGILKPGYAISERDIQNTVYKIFEKAEGRIVFTTFSTTISRIQHVLNACDKYGRKLAVTGRSMINNFRTCFELGYIKVPENILVDFNQLDKLRDEEICILSTGSQGEDMSALSRMARDEHQTVKLQAGDAVIFSSSQIPGNEESIQDLIAKLSRKGVDVFSPKEFNLHVSGHACHEDMKMLFALTRPDYLQPIHGDHYMLKAVGKLGAQMGIPPENNLIGENGRIVELRPDKVVLTEEIISESYLLVEGDTVGSVSEVVLMERRQMSTQGSIILVLMLNKQKQLVAGPEVISRGFVYMKNSSDLFDRIKDQVRKDFKSLKLDPKSKTYFSELRKELKNRVSDFIFKTTDKDPMVIPVVVQL